MTWRDHLRRLVMEGREGPVRTDHWARTYGLPEETITEALSEFRKERDEIEALRVRLEAEGD